MLRQQGAEGGRGAQRRCIKIGNISAQPGWAEQTPAAEAGVAVLAVGHARPSSIQKGTRVLISLWDSLMFGRVVGYTPEH